MLGHFPDIDEVGLAGLVGWLTGALPFRFVGGLASVLPNQESVEFRLEVFSLGSF